VRRWEEKGEEDTTVCGETVEGGEGCGLVLSRIKMQKCKNSKSCQVNLAQNRTPWYLPALFIHALALLDQNGNRLVGQSFCWGSIGSRWEHKAAFRSDRAAPMRSFHGGETGEVCGLHGRAAAGGTIMAFLIQWPQRSSMAW
jgi:hypothetical protein